MGFEDLNFDSIPKPHREYCCDITNPLTEAECGMGAMGKKEEKPPPQPIIQPSQPVKPQSLFSPVNIGITVVGIGIIILLLMTSKGKD